MRSTLFLTLCLLIPIIYSKMLSRPNRQMLESPTATLRLYQDFKTQEHVSYSYDEDRIRFALFKKNAQLVSDLNSKKGETAQYELNAFSALSIEEKIQLGEVNVTGKLKTDQYPDPPSRPYLELETKKVPKRTLWVKRGAVTPVKDRGACKSTWAFAMVDAIETDYKIKSGRLREFSAQELIDCTYVKSCRTYCVCPSIPKDGCAGGNSHDGLSYVRVNRGGELAASADYPYTGSSGDCRADHTKNAAIAYKIAGSIGGGRGIRPYFNYVESEAISLLSEGPLVMAMKMTEPFYQYGGGIYKDLNCKNQNFGYLQMAGVGYTEKYTLVKNSWGTGWGDKGFIKMARNYDHCGLYICNLRVKLVPTGEKDEGEDDQATNYDPGDEDGYYDEDEFRDWRNENDRQGREDQSKSRQDFYRNRECYGDSHKHCRKEFCVYEEFAGRYCRKTCEIGRCGKEKDCDCKDKWDACWNAHCRSYDFSQQWCRKTCKICSCD